MRSTLPLLVAVLVAGACATKDQAADQSADADAAAPSASADANALPEMVVEAADYSFAAPDSVEAGWTKIRLVNHGPSLHHVQLVRITDGHSLDDFVAAMKNPGPPQPWIQMVGGPNAPAPGAESTDDVNLQPGLYALTCIVPDSTGTPHMMLGMIRPLTVEAKENGAAEPTGDMTIKLVDYGFEPSAPYTAGHHRIRVENAGPQPHEILIVRLNPGKTAQDIATYAEHMTGPPPGMPLGGTSVMMPGDVQFVDVDLEPGEYALLCFMPDTKDGVPHAAHGMMTQFSVS